MSALHLNLINMSFKPPAFIQTTPRVSRLLSRRHRPTRQFTCCASQPSIEASIPALASAIQTASITASENLNETLRRISLTDPHVNAFLTIDVDQLQARAGEIDKKIANGDRVGPLAGVPIAIKDNICTKGLPTTAASRILDGFTPAYNATVVSRLEAAGAIILGKTNMDEFGMGSSTETSAYGITKNPCNLDRVPGGSSGGSAASIAAGVCLAALGSDTGGSIRQPASFCNVTGMRPSYGRVSRYGLLAYASSLDTIGPICSSVEDTALILQIIAGHDTMDATSVDAPVPDFVTGLQDTSLSSIRVGVVREAFGEAVDPDVISAVRGAVDQLAELGATVEEVSLPRLDACVAPYYVLAMSEASANLARYDGVRYGQRDSSAENSNLLYAQTRANGFGVEVKRRIMAGTFSLSSGYYDAYYLRAQRVRQLMADDVQHAFTKGFDVLISPVSPTPAFKIGELLDDPVLMYLNDIMALPASLAGIPSISVPCGFSSHNLPVGMQISAPYLADDVALRVANAFQKSTSHHTRTKHLVDEALSVKV